MNRLVLPGLALIAALAAAALGRPWLALAAVLVALFGLQPLLLGSRRGHPSTPRRLTDTAIAATERSARTTKRVAVGLLRGLIRVVFAAVALVVGAIVFYLVLTPLGLGARLLGVGLLATGDWHEHPASTPAAGRRAHVGGRGGRGSVRAGNGRLSWRVAVALVAVGALVATLIPALVDRDPDESAIPEQRRGNTFDAFDSPALDDADWKEDAGAEFAEASGGQTYTSFVGNSLRDFEGEHVNITDRQRRSYAPTATGGAEPISVWFFGGSTMFGFSAQRDLHTIPSEFVRLAEADGVTVEAHNFGAPGYVNMQETILLSQLLAAGEQPDLIVFYDGINDLAVQFQQAFGGIGVPGDPSDITAYAYRQLLAGQLTGSDLPPAPLTSTPDMGQPPQAQAVIGSILDVYGRGIELASALGDHYGIPVVHFWQPDLFNKAELAPGEQTVVDRLGMDAFQYEAVARISRALAAQLPDPAVDITGAFDGVADPVLTDEAHTNELGARLVAEAMYARVGPSLGTLDGG